MTASRIFLYLCLSFISGIFIRSEINISGLTILGFLILGIVSISVFWRYKKIAVAGFCILLFAAGIGRYSSVESEIVNSSLFNLNDKEYLITLIGIVAEDPDIREKNTALTVNTQEVKYGSYSSPISGKVLVTTSRYPEYQYGDKLAIKGKLIAPQIKEGFNYRNYLRKEGIYSAMNWPGIEILGKDLGNPLMKSILSFKNKFKEADREFFSPPQLGLLEALTFGDESNVPKEWKDLFNNTGTRHITAVSGMNITIISSLILSFVLSLGLWRKHALLVSFFLIFVYILMIGAPASALRAAVMAGLLMLGQYFGRLVTSSRTVVFAAFFMVFLNPFLLKDDVGFQLSFLAVLGMIYFQPFFSEWMRLVPDPKVFPLKTVLATTFSAQIFTLPILIFNFGRISLISPITNIFIVPLLAPITVLIFLFGLISMIFIPFGFILFPVVWLFLEYIITVIELSAKIPYATLVIEKIYFGWLVFFYAVLGLIAWRLRNNRRLKFLNY